MKPKYAVIDEEIAIFFGLGLISCIWCHMILILNSNVEKHVSSGILTKDNTLRWNSSELILVGKRLSWEDESQHWQHWVAYSDVWSILLCFFFTFHYAMFFFTFHFSLCHVFSLHFHFFHFSFCSVFFTFHYAMPARTIHCTPLVFIGAKWANNKSPQTLIYPPGNFWVYN